jgi:hypothetical protein
MLSGDLSMAVTGQVTHRSPELCDYLVFFELPKIKKRLKSLI